MNFQIIKQQDWLTGEPEIVLVDPESMKDGVWHGWGIHGQHTADTHENALQQLWEGMLKWNAPGLETKEQREDRLADEQDSISPAQFLRSNWRTRHN